jgi:hypothetical protein
MKERKTTQYEEKHSQSNSDETITIIPEGSTPMIQEQEIMICNEDSEDEEGEFDFDDVLVLPAEGLLIKHNEDEVRLLFFYVKPTLRKTTSFKAVTELRIPRQHFLHIAGEIQEMMMEFNKNGQTEPHLIMYG